MEEIEAENISAGLGPDLTRDVQVGAKRKVLMRKALKIKTGLSLVLTDHHWQMT